MYLLRYTLIITRMGELFRVPDCDFLIVNNQCAAACFGRARRHETPSTLTGVAMSTAINRLACLLNRPQAEPPGTRPTHVTVANFAAQRSMVSLQNYSDKAVFLTRLFADSRLSKISSSSRDREKPQTRASPRVSYPPDANEFAY